MNQVNVHNHGRKQNQAERDISSDEQEQAANDLEYGDDVKVMAQEKCFGEVSNQRWLRRWHRNEMQKDVRSEHDENEAEKNPSDDSSDFHDASCADSAEISNLMLVASVGPLDSGPVENGFQNLFGFEDFTRNVPSCARMFRVVGIDSLHGVGDFVHGSKRQESVLAGVIFRETGFLRDDRTAGCQIARAAVAEPASVESDILILGNGELPFGTLDIIAVEPVIDAHLKR